MSQEESLSISSSNKKIIHDAQEILNFIETTHQNDLSVHLYSAYLLKKMLIRANKKRYHYETNQFIKKNIKESWTRWPNKHTIINPAFDQIYTDPSLRKTIPIETSSNDTEDPDPTAHGGIINEQCLHHGEDIMKSEMESHYQRLLKKSLISSSNNDSHKMLDLESIELPQDISTFIFGKLIGLLEVLHTNATDITKVDLEQDPNSLKIRVVDTEKKPVKICNPGKFKIDYTDILSVASQMEVNTSNIQKKCEKLFYAIPNSFRRKLFKLDETTFEKYEISQSTLSLDNNFLKSNDAVVRLEHLLHHRKTNKKVKKILFLLSENDKEKSKEMKLNSLKKLNSELKPKNSLSKDDYLIKIPKI